MTRFYLLTAIIIFFLSQTVIGKNTSLINGMLESFNNLTSYSATLYTKDAKETTEIKYFYKKPGFIEMKFISPHNGAELTYNPKTNKVIVKPFKSMSFTMTLSPDSSLISKDGHTVDKSDLGTLLKKVKILSNNAEVKVTSNEFFHEITIAGRNGFSVDDVNIFILKVDSFVKLPVIVQSFDSKGKIIETLEIRNLQVK